ncbi:hypothetical protein C1H71_11310 [Iodobacter fluviatilis]|uniref:Uncharacterized protein n=1 Tax=Iodobacter fluviatilis TaxID=537 RepID=A0A7G3GA34_9NEIS|nr:hypothetical protein C1H71_11310 [Iodobacter fluviatilis]
MGGLPKKWTMPIQNWHMALNRFVIEFGDLLNGHQSFQRHLHRKIYRLNLPALHLFFEFTRVYNLKFIRNFLYNFN